MWREEDFNFDNIPANASQRFWEELQALPEPVIEMAAKADWEKAIREFLEWVISLVSVGTRRRYQARDIAKSLYRRADILEKWRAEIVKPSYDRAKARWEEFKEKAPRARWGKKVYSSKRKELWTEYKLTGELSASLRELSKGLRRVAGQLWGEYKELPQRLEALLKEMGVKVYKNSHSGELQAKIVDFRKALPWILQSRDRVEVHYINKALDYYNEIQGF